MKLPLVQSNRIDLIMVFLFASVVIGLVGNGLYCMTNKVSEAYFLNKKEVY